MPAALSAGTRCVSGSDAGERWLAAKLLPHADPRRARTWRAARWEGRIALFTGFIANAAEIARDLGMEISAVPDASELARLYAAYITTQEAKGSDRADLGLVGEYAAALIEPERQVVRLSRSPLRAPPLHVYQDTQRVLVASVPRAIQAAGYGREIDPEKFADNAWFNHASAAPHWYKGLSRVALGSTVHFSPEREQHRRYYSVLDVSPVRLPKPQDYVEAARALLDEGVKACLTGFSKPAMFLSGGLDSSQVAASVLRMQPGDRILQTFTFTVGSDWDGTAPAGMFGDERPYVEAFATMHPRIRTNFFDNAGSGFDLGLREMFHLAGLAPVNMTNFSVFHAPWGAARAAGCDVVLLSEWGNETFSNTGDWAHVEFLLRFRWRELVKALRDLPDDPRPLWRRIVGNSILPLLPRPVWHWQRRMRGQIDGTALASPLRADYVERMNLRQRAEAAGIVAGNRPLRSRREFLQSLDQLATDESSDLWQGFEQYHGVPQRDPTAYRPLVEFCFGLPTEVLVRDGQSRWLAREMGRGDLPEMQRLNQREGRHHADWFARLTRQRAELDEELARLETIPELAEVFDFPRLRAVLADWPDRTPTDPAASLPREVALTRGIAMARFANFVSGRN